MRRRRLGLGAILHAMACGGAVTEAATHGSSGSADTAGSPGAAESGASVTGDDGLEASTSAAPASSSSDATATSAESTDASVGESSGESTGAGALGCDELPLCDGFEGDAAGGPPHPSRWSVVSPDCSGTGTLAITDEVAHGGTQSVRIDGGGGYCDHVFLSHGPAIADAAGGEVWVRVWLRLEQALGPSHVTFAALTDAADGGAALRMGGQSGILMWNRESDDATLPALSPTGISMSVAPTPGEWTCVEFMIDGQGGRLSTFVDGDAVAALQVDGRPTADVDQQWLQAGAWNPEVVDLQLGWESYGGSTMVLFVDDVAVSGARVGCEG